MRSTSHESLAAPARIAASYPDPGWRRTDTVLPGDGLRIATFETGRRDAGAPVLLLVHGLGHWTQAAWDRLAPELASEYRIVSLDLPGFGESSKPDVEYRLPFFVDVLRRFVEARGLEEIVLVGRPGPEVEVRIIGPDGADVEPGAIGEVVCRSPAMMRGYWQDLDLTAARGGRTRTAKITLTRVKQ